MINIFEEVDKYTRSYKQHKEKGFFKYSGSGELYGYDYYDNRKAGGYGGYFYDERFEIVAEKIIKIYNPHRILEIGCAKGFLIYELIKKGVNAIGIDISYYAIHNTLSDVKPFLIQANVKTLPFKKNSFDFVVTRDVMEHIKESDLDQCLDEIDRVCNGSIFFHISGGNTLEEKEIARKWDITHVTIHSYKWWEKKIKKHIRSNKFDLYLKTFKIE